MKQTIITTDRAVFVVLSFEGPDRYSLAGGLGTRVTNLSQTLAETGFPTHLFFIGDPGGMGEENRGQLILHRWCQWISHYYPNGVYQGENEKLYDFNRSIPPFVFDNIVAPVARQDKLVVILGEEWHTAEAMCRISDLLASNNLRDRVVMFWNANNTFGFDRIDWKRLAGAVTITTVSRYMKHTMWALGVNPLVIPNGIPSSLLNEVDAEAAKRLRESLDADLVLSKVARWDPDKRWNMAVAAVAGLKSRGIKTRLLARGGMEAHGAEVMSNARSLGLTVRDVRTRGNTLDDYLGAIEEAYRADILNIRFYCPQALLQLIYHISDAVLINSAREPFGLVGLEAMAAGGIAFTGGTGEDYAIPFHNAIVLETPDPKEIENYVMYLGANPEQANRIRRAARETARLFVWKEVIKNLLQKLEYQARIQGLPEKPSSIPLPESKPLGYPGAAPEAVLTKG